MKPNWVRILTNVSLVTSIVLVSAILACDCLAGQFEGYTEPCDSANVAAAETGIITAIDVREGDAVHEGQVLARLDDELHRALLAIAKEAMRAKGSYDSAQAEYQLRKHRFDTFKKVHDQGHARQEEVERARADLAIAEAGVRAAQENLVIKKLEYEKIRVQIARRTIRAPMDGVVTKLHKKKGEYVGPSDPYILQMAKLDPLLAKFSLPSRRARQMRVGHTVMLRMEANRRTVEGTIEFIGPVTDAQSGTVQIKARINNSEGLFYSGERCTLLLPDDNLAQWDDPRRATTQHGKSLP